MTVRSTSFSLATILAVMAALALAVGCGGDDNGSTASAGGGAAAEAEGGGEAKGDVTTSSLDKAAFVKRADAICARGSGAALEYEEPTGANLSPSELYERAIKASLAPAFRQVAASLRELGAPDGDEAEVTAYVEALETGVDEMEQRSSTITSLGQVEKLLHSAGNVARRYGIESCAFG